MEAVDAHNALWREDRLLDQFEVYVPGHALKEYVRGLPHNAHRTADYYEADQHAYQRVGPVPARVIDDDRADYNADGSRRVADDMQKRALDIQVFFGETVEPRGDDEVYDEANCGDDKNADALYRLRLQ